MKPNKIPKLTRRTGLSKSFTVSFPIGATSPAVTLGMRKLGVNDLYNWLVHYSDPDRFKMSRYVKTNELRELLKCLSNMTAEALDSADVTGLILAVSAVSAQDYRKGFCLSGLDISHGVIPDNPEIWLREMDSGIDGNAAVWDSRRDKALKACRSSLHYMYLYCNEPGLKGRRVRLALSYIARIRDDIRTVPLQVIFLSPGLESADRLSLKAWSFRTGA